MKILIIGCNGQLGNDMVSVCQAEGYTTKAIDYPDIDITDRTLTETIIKDVAPDTIINCAAYTAVDECESNTDIAYQVNAEGVANIASSAQTCDASIVHISTDYVFNGKKGFAYTESDLPNPESVYGKSKLEGEKRLSEITDNFFTFRIAWLYGAHGNNFVKTIRNIALKNQEAGKPLKVVNDQFGTPTYTKDICRQVLKTLSTQQYGLYHCTNEGECTWYDFTCHIMKQLKIDIRIEPCTTDEYPRPAPRPRYSVLENHNLKTLGINIMPHWKESFSTFLQEIQGIEF